ncbi:hypothetical protein LLE49_25575 [Alicyclobacillus tolerans]|uniref:hypothetical protein n=1 Tax=Alicyclobacillus tolerans TaxID=90970 RepID=UPI001F381FBD|nr:hypothetical protein [Alicyclobacillus tolerans]MCF8568099.1 hypothetical protein [Alicyclobacillus tolerans]
MRKDSFYREVDLEAIMDSLKPGESKEMYPVYIGKMQRFPTRLVVYKLTPEQTEKRRKTRATNETKKNITYLGVPTHAHQGKQPRINSFARALNNFS